MKVSKAINHWGTKYPIFHCSRYDDYKEICDWMYKNGVEHFLWSSGSNGYTFDIRKKLDWFLLKWS